MSSLLYRLGRGAVHARRLVVLLWLIALAVAGGGAALLSQGTDDTFRIPDSQSQDALDHLSRVFPQVSGTSAELVVVVPEGARVATPEIRNAVGAAVAEIESLEQVALALDPFSDLIAGALSPDGRAALIAVPLDVQYHDVTPETREALTGIAADLEDRIGGGAVVHAGGDALHDMIPKLTVTEAVGCAIALLVLLVLFRSFVAAGLPLLTAVVGVAVSAGLIFAATVATPVSSTAPMLAVMLGLAVGIDYALFLLSRHRDQLAEGLTVEESVARATATAGSAVIFAGLTVVIALLGLAVAGIPFLTTMGAAAAVGVVLAVLVAVTLIPALLGFAGERLRPRPRRRRRAALQRTRRRPSLVWVRLVTRFPALTVVVVVAGLGVCALPAADLRLALPDRGTAEVGTAARDTYDVISQHFGPGTNGPLVVTIDVLSTTDPVGITNGIAEEIRQVEGVASVPLATPNPKGDTSIVQVVPASAPESAETERLVERLRAMQDHFRERYGVDTAVTGITAVGIDVSARLAGALLPFGALVVGLSLVLLAMVFRSVWVPVKAAAGYLLSVGAAFGATSFVFVQGHFAEALDVTRVGPVVNFLPIVLMGVLFGLAMDYEVFLVSRIREDYVHNGDARRAIETGFVSASRVVVAAAVIMIAVFAAFVPDAEASVKAIAFSLGVGVFVDAFVVRMTLVPAVLALLGERAWWLPAWLDRRLPVFDAEGDGLVRELRLAGWPAPDSPEVVSARGLRIDDDLGRPVLAPVDLHLRPGEVLAVASGRPAGKTALLYALGGRMSNLAGDLKVCGLVLPQQAQAVRRQVALVPCRDTPDVVRALQRALGAGARLVLLDDLDTVVDPAQRAALRTTLAALTRDRDARASTAVPVPAVVVTCQDAGLLADVLPVARLRTLSLTAPLAEVA